MKIEKIQLPTIFNKEWIDIAIKMLNTQKMSIEKRTMLEMTLAKNATIFYVYEDEKEQYAKKILERMREGDIFLIEQELAEQKKVIKEQCLLAEKKLKMAIQKGLDLGMEIATITEVTGIPIEKIKEVQNLK